MLSEIDAAKVIVGQVAAIGYPDMMAGDMCSKRKIGQKSWTESVWNGLAATATIAMHKCWTRSCSGMQA